MDEGTLGGQAFTIDLENGGLAMEISESYAGGDEDAIAELQAQVDELIEGIVAGDIVIFPEEEAPAPEATEEG